MIADSTLLFFAPNVAWHCSYTNGVVGYNWLDADFVSLDRCTCATETYRVDGYPRNGYKLVSSDPRGSFVRSSDTTFTYTEYEYTDSTSIHSSISMIFDPSKVVRDDTAYTESLSTGNMEMMITEFVELKAY